VSIPQTTAYMKSNKCIQDQHNRLVEILDWVCTNYSKYFREVMVVVTNEDQSIKDLNDLEGNMRNFQYSILDGNLVKAFMSTNKVKLFCVMKTLKAQKKQEVLNQIKRIW